jgi:hypothetical protein
LGKDPDAFIAKHGDPDGDGSHANNARKAKKAKSAAGGPNHAPCKKTESKEWTVTGQDAIGMKERVSKLIDAWCKVSGEGELANPEMRLIVDFGDAKVKNAVLDAMI